MRNSVGSRQDWSLCGSSGGSSRGSGLLLSNQPHSIGRRRKKKTYVVQEIVNLVDTCLESCCCLGNDSGVSIGLGLFIKG
jgi:hypothetical protein